MITILQTAYFKKKVKKIHKNEKRDLDLVIKKILKDPLIGVSKKGDLDFVRIYKFRMIGQLMLLAYTERENSIVLLDIGSHENFYRDLKKKTH